MIKRRPIKPKKKPKPPKWDQQPFMKAVKLDRLRGRIAFSPPAHGGGNG